MTTPNLNSDNSLKPFLLGEWKVDPEALQIQLDGQLVSVQAKAMQVLLVLVHHRGEVVRKEVLLDAVWTHGFVVEGVLKRSISDLRKALGDNASSPKYIETIPKRGYRLISDVDWSAKVDDAVLDSTVEPYLGLETFSFEQAELFFGREVACTQICKCLVEQTNNGIAFTLVLGMSGVGKSSIVQAGVLPRLVRDGIDRWTLFRHSDIPGDLFNGLASAFLSRFALPSLYNAGSGQSELAAQLREQPDIALTRLMRHIKRNHDDANFYLVIDQMEELFAFKRVDDQERSSFFALLGAMAKSGCISLIATMRSDFYHRFCESSVLCELKSGGGQFDLGPPTAAEIRSIIRKPARLAGLVFEEAGDESSSSLDEVIADSAIKYPEALPLLQFILHELYKRRDDNGCMTFSAYHSLGGVEGCLGQRAEETYTAQSPNTKRALPHVLGALVTTADSDSVVYSLKPSLRRNLVIDRHSGYLVDALTEARLLTTHLTPDGEFRVVRVAHEALIVHWSRARNWLTENSSLVRSHRFLEEAVSRWDREGRRDDLLLSKGWQLTQAEVVRDSSITLNSTEKNYLQLSQRQAHKKNRLVRSLVVSFSSLIFVAFGALFFAHGKNRIADLERYRATQESVVANRTISLLSNMFEFSDPAATRSQNLTPIEMLDEAAERVLRDFNDAPVVQSTLLQTLGVIYNRRGRYEEAGKLLTTTVASRTAALGENHPLVADALTDLATNHHDIGEFENALTTNQRALDLRTTYYGKSHRKIAESLHQKGWFLHSVGKPDDAESIVRRALTMQVELQDQGVKDLELDVATSHKSLGVFLFQKGALKEAEAHLQTALTIRQAQLGNSHPDVGMSLNHMAALYTSSRDYVRAKKFSEQALRLNLELLGDGHPDVALSYYNLAGVHYRLHEYDIAAQYAKSCIEININALGEEHGIVAITKGFLGGVRVAQRKPKEALELLSDSKHILDTLLPQDHWRIAWLSAIEGAALAELGEKETAEKMLLDAYQSIGSSKGTADDATLRVRAYVENLYHPNTQASDYERVQEKLRMANLAVANN